MAPQVPQVGLTQDVGWEIGVSRTLPAPLHEVWELLVSTEGVALWLGGGVVLPPERGVDYETDDGTVGWWRSVREKDRLRLSWRPASWDHDSTVQVAVVPAGGGRTTLRFHQEHLASAQEREQQRRYWHGVAGGLSALLPGRGGTPA